MTALTDAVADHPKSLEECFPGSPDVGWPVVKAQYAETVGADGRWRLPIHAFLVRSPTQVVLIDQGVGCDRTIASEVFGVEGSLPTQLDRLGVSPETVDKVVFTHIHEDHLGWANDPESGAPTFPGAEYHVFEREWAANHDTETPDWVVQALDPLWSGDRLVSTGLGRLTDDIELVALPGHSAGHIGLVIDGPDARVVVVGDAFNHPYQITQPTMASIADADRAQAVRTRQQILTRITSGEWPVLASAHLPGAWWTASPGDGGLRWSPTAVDGVHRETNR